MNFMPVRQFDLPMAQRAQGRLALGFRRHGAATRVQEFYQSGCLKTRLPRPVDAGTAEAVTMNISGGVAGGDVLTTRVIVETDARVSIASQAAERIYRALAEPARITTRISVQAGAEVEYLPQETIFFDGFALNRSLEIELGEGASFLGVESLVFGRKAMGEQVTVGVLRDRISLSCNGKLVLEDLTRLDGDISAKLGRKAIGRGAAAVASLILVGPGALGRLPALREALAGAHAGASAFEGIVFARILAPDGAALRNTLRAALAALRDGRAMPRVWQG